MVRERGGGRTGLDFKVTYLEGGGGMVCGVSGDEMAVSQMVHMIDMYV